MPVLAAWLDDALHFVAGRRSRRAAAWLANLRRAEELFVAPSAARGQHRLHLACPSPEAVAAVLRRPPRVARHPHAPPALLAAADQAEHDREKPCADQPQAGQVHRQLQAAAFGQLQRAHEEDDQPDGNVEPDDSVSRCMPQATITVSAKVC